LKPKSGKKKNKVVQNDIKTVIDESNELSDKTDSIEKSKDENVNESIEQKESLPVSPSGDSDSFFIIKSSSFIFINSLSSKSSLRFFGVEQRGDFDLDLFFFPELSVSSLFKSNSSSL
jgi:hypothetical protein